MNLTRRAFGQALTGSAAVLSIPGCGGGDGNDAAAPGCSAVGAAISQNHGHTLAFAAPDVDSPDGLTYGIRGSADHDHTVTFSAAELRQLKAGQSVTVTASVSAAHAHAVTVTCAQP